VIEKVNRAAADQSHRDCESRCRCGRCNKPRADLLTKRSGSLLILGKTQRRVGGLQLLVGGALERELKQLDLAHALADGCVLLLQLADVAINRLLRALANILLAFAQRAHAFFGILNAGLELARVGDDFDNAASNYRFGHMYCSK
jgi:hypothetical protein